MTPRKMVPSGTALCLSLLSLFALGGRSASAQTNPPMPPGQPMPDQGANPAPSSPVPGTSEALPPPAQEPAPVPMPPPPPVMPPPPAPAPVATPTPPVPPVAVKPTVNAKFAADLYGFVEFDSIFDTTQSLGENAGNGAIAKSTSFAGDHKRLTFTPRNSRIGVKLKGPDSENIHTSAILEMDFLGNQPTTATEAQTLQNATFRIRHMAAKLETPYVDILAGQYWQLFGWQSYFQPNTVEIQGVPGEVYSRAPQFRLSHAFKTEDVTVEIAVAASRPPQRDGSNWIPDAQGGLRFLVNNWKGWHTPGSVATAYDAGGIGVSGVFRRFNVNDLSGSATTTHAKNGGGISVDALIPVLPGRADSRDFALTLTGSYVRGAGIADLFSGLTGGVTFPPATGSAAYTPNIDPGDVVYDGGGNLHVIEWQAIMGGLQFYLPYGLWVSGNYMYMNSPNIVSLESSITPAAQAAAIKRSQWADGNLFWDVNKAFRVGGEVAWFKQTYGNDSVATNPAGTVTTATNWRFQGSVFYIF